MNKGPTDSSQTISLGPRWIWALGSFLWIAVLIALSVAFLHSFDSGMWSLRNYALYGLVALLLLLGFYVTQRVALILKVKSDADFADRKVDHPEQGHDADRPVAILLVHGMGVQDRYQFLSDFKKGLVDFSVRYNVFEQRQRPGSQDFVSLLVQPANGGQQKQVELHEAFWGHHFNGVTTWMSTTIFAVKTLYKFIPTLWSRLYRKRWFEAFWVFLALGAVIGGLFGVYGGFRLSALRLEYFERRSPGYVPSEADKSASKPSANQLKLRDPELEYIRFQGEVPSRPIPYSERVHETVTFVSHAYSSLWDALKSGGTDPSGTLLIPIERPFKTLAKVPATDLLMGLAYLAAFAFAAVSLLQLLFAQIALIKSDLLGSKKSRQFNYRIGFEAWWKSTSDCIRKGGISTLVLLLLDPTLQILIVQLFASAAVLVVLVSGYKYWMTNFLGDVEIYENSNENSKFWKARTDATSAIRAQIERLMQSDRYRCVVVVAHSLGTVITLQAIRQIAAEESRRTNDHPKLPGLAAFVTIGSPLRKFRQLFRIQPYKWDFAEFNVRKDRHIFRGEQVPPHGDVPWYNFWYSSDIFADRLAFIPIGKLKGRVRSDKNAIQGAQENEKDRTGFQVGAHRDYALGFRPGVWTHSDYWYDDRFVDRLLFIALNSPRCFQADGQSSDSDTQSESQTVMLTPEKEASVRGHIEEAQEIDTIEPDSVSIRQADSE